MNLTRVLYSAAGLVLASAVAFAGQADVAKVQKLKNPAALTEKAPATFKVNFDTSKGSIVVTVHRDWAPNGADRLYNLVKAGFYDDVRFFRVIPNFMAQFGIHGNPAVMSAWRSAQIKDDPVGDTPPWWVAALRIHASARDGDTDVVKLAGQSRSRGDQVFVVSADRRLRSQLNPDVTAVSPSWLLTRLAGAGAS